MTSIFTRGRIFSHVSPFYERAVSDLDPQRSMLRPGQVAHSSFIEGSHTTKNMASVLLKRSSLPKRINIEINKLEKRLPTFLDNIFMLYVCLSLTTLLLQTFFFSVIKWSSFFQKGYFRRGNNRCSTHICKYYTALSFF